MKTCPVLCAAVLAAALLPTATAAARPDASPAAQQGRVDLRRQANVTIVSAKAFDRAGRLSAGAGDVNGDGVDDVIVGAPGVDGAGRPDAGAAYVVFGHRTTAKLQRQALDARGFRILGPTADAAAGASVAPAGDVDGDGLDDVAVASTPLPRSGEAWQDGAVWIVYGKRDASLVDLAQPGTAATRLTGPPTFGMYLAGGRDVDGDGIPDLAVAAPAKDVASDGRDAAVYVVRGTRERTALDVRDGGARVLTIDVPDPAGASPGPGAEDHVIVAPPATAVALADDMNGDGRAEVAIGAKAETRRTGDGAGAFTPSSITLAHVVYGRPAPATVTVDDDDLGADGFAIRARGVAHGLAVRGLSGGGDVNGDGRGDLALGDLSGNAAYVVYGGALSGSVEVGRTTGLAVTGPRNTALGGGVAIVGDVNGDGRDDLLAGAMGARPLGRELAGAAYLVFGRAARGSVDVTHLGRRRGFWLAGAHRWDGTGDSVSPAGDFNGDGRADLLIGGRSADRAQDERGVAYIVYGFGPRR